MKQFRIIHDKLINVLNKLNIILHKLIRFKIVLCLELPSGKPRFIKKVISLMFNTNLEEFKATLFSVKCLF